MRGVERDVAREWKEREGGQEGEINAVRYVDGRMMSLTQRCAITYSYAESPAWFELLSRTHRPPVRIGLIPGSAPCRSTRMAAFCLIQAEGRVDEWFLQGGV